jgi:hypothetical protein
MNVTPIASVTRLMAVTVALLILGACGSGDSSRDEASAPAPEESDANDDFTAPPLEVPEKCARPSSEIQLTTIGVRWVGLDGKAAEAGELCISAPAEKDLNVLVDNPRRKGIINNTHNFSIYSDSLGFDPIFHGPFVKTGKSRSYSIPALEAGAYLFRCDPHGRFMKGVLTVQ